MNTPICDFIKSYASSSFHRLHMPGHKGEPFLGCEELDVTEIKGADSLYCADGIIKESENNASLIFDCPTFYSTEGSSHCIRAMLYLAAYSNVKKVLAGRNAHKTFITAAALLNLEVEWIMGNSSYLSCTVTPETLEKEIIVHRPGAVYITSPDYLGNVADVKELSKVCKKHNVLLLVDCAHGAYLKFLPESLYPTDLGADMCCSSAHKTLPCLTGGAYLHVKDKTLCANAKSALSLFGSTSPSYLILQSLDNVNKYICETYKKELRGFILKAERAKKELRGHGYTLFEQEPLKIVVCTKSYGYTGTDFAEILRKNRIECEFSDPDFTVLMLGIKSDIEYVKRVLLSIPPKPPITVFPPVIAKPERVMDIKSAIMSKRKEVNAYTAEGEIFASLNLACPPAVPILVCGERISKEAIEAFKYYAIEKCEIVSK